MFGIEGAGSWGAGLCTAPAARRPHRRRGRTSATGPSAARGSPTASTRSRPPSRCWSARELSTPRRRGVLSRRYGRCWSPAAPPSRSARTLLNQLQALNATALVALRERVGDGTGKRLERRVLSMRSASQRRRRRTRGVRASCATSRRAPRALAADARRYEQDFADSSARPRPAPSLDEPGIGPISAAKLLASDPARLKHEAAFARCNGTAPLPASSGKTVRHRLSRGGDRQVNNAIHTIAPHPRQAPTRNARLPRPPHQRREDQARSDARAQTPNLPRPVQTPRRDPIDFIEASVSDPDHALAVPGEATLQGCR